jgi:plastocyanin
MAQKHPTRKVVIKNFSFKPAHITIKRGTKVRWINRDSTAHTATANKKRSFDSGRLSPGQRYTHTFKRAGKQRYHCEIHPDMRANVVVKSLLKRLRDRSTHRGEVNLKPFGGLLEYGLRLPLSRTP